MSTIELRVCLDCRYTLAGIADENEDMRNTWTEICERFPAAHIVNDEQCHGTDCEDCGGDCNGEPGEVECQCGWDSFSMQDCDTCGSGVAGDRFRHAAFVS